MGSFGKGFWNVNSTTVFKKYLTLRQEQIYWFSNVIPDKLSFYLRKVKIEYCTLFTCVRVRISKSYLRSKTSSLNTCQNKDTSIWIKPNCIFYCNRAAYSAPFFLINGINVSTLINLFGNSHIHPVMLIYGYQDGPVFYTISKYSWQPEVISRVREKHTWNSLPGPFNWLMTI